MSTSLTPPRCHPQLAPRSGATSSLPAAHLPSPQACRLGYRAGLPRCAGAGVRSEGGGAGPRRRGARSSAASGAALGRAVGLCRCSPALSSPNRHRSRAAPFGAAPTQRAAERGTAADGLAGTCGGDARRAWRGPRRAVATAAQSWWPRTLDSAAGHCTPLQRRQELCCARRADQMAAEPHEDALHQEAAPVLEPQPVLELERAPELEPN